MQILHTLESKSYVAGGNVQVSLRDLPPKMRVKALFSRLEATWTQSGSAAAISGDDLCCVFANVELGKRVKGTGRYFERLNWMMRGSQLNFPAQIPATNSGVFRRTPTLVIPFSDLGAASPDDAAQHTEFFRETPLIVDFAAAGSTALGATITVAGTLRTIALLDDAEQGVVPSPVQMGYIDWAGQQVQLEPGLYTHLFLFKEAVGNVGISNAEVSSVSVLADGRPVVNLLRPEELGAVDDYYFSNGSDVQSESATVPMGAEQITTEPGVAAAAAATVTSEYVPLVQSPHNYKLTQCLHVEHSLRLDFQGTLTTFRIGYRRIEPRSVDAALKAMQKTGVGAPDATRIRAKTHSKKDLTGAKARFLQFLPLRHD